MPVQYTHQRVIAFSKLWIQCTMRDLESRLELLEPARSSVYVQKQENPHYPSDGMYLVSISKSPNNPAYNSIFNHPNHELYTNKPRASKPLAIRARQYVLAIQDLNPHEEINYTPPWTLIHPNIDLRLRNLTRKKTTNAAVINKFNDLTHNDNEEIYTDGSKTPNSTGFAIISRNHQQKRKLKPAYSIYTAEISAIASALYTTIFSRNKSYTICTDSLSSLH